MKDLNKTMIEWKDKYENCKASYADQLKLMNRSQRQYDGTLQPDSGRETVTLYNMTKELIETTIDSQIPMPKVEADVPSEKNKLLASIAEDLCKHEIKRLKLAENNDEDERTTRTMGGDIYFVEWNNLIKTHTTVGAVNVRVIKPTQVIPQAKLFRKDYMDYIFLDFDVTKKSIKEKYGIDVNSEDLDSEKGTDINNDLVTQHYVFFRNSKGTIGCYSWVGETEILNQEEYQCRSEKVCKKCGRAKSGKVCECGSKEFVLSPLAYEELTEDIVRSDGSVIPATTYARDEDGNFLLEDVETPVMEIGFDGMGYSPMPVYDRVFDDKGQVIGEKPVTKIEQQPYQVPTKIPYYIPKGFPIIVRKNVSSANKFIGDGDAEMVYEIQDKMNKVATRMVDKLYKAGSILKKPKELDFNFANCEQVVEFDNIADAQGIGVVNLTFDTQSDMNTLNYLYNTAKSMLGISDTFQGKQDTTAKSGRAKEVQIQRALGRQESKTIMKNAAYAELYKMIFEYNLAYSDEPRKFESHDEAGEVVEGTFSRYDFLEQDEFGNWYYNDQFTFTTDSAGSASENRQFVLDTMEMDFKSGLYGNIADPETILALWKDREAMNYPNAKRQVARWAKKVQLARMNPMPMQIGGDGNAVSNLPE